MSITVRNDTTGTLGRQISEDVLETTDEEESVSEYAETSVSEYAETSDSEEESVSAKIQEEASLKSKIVDAKSLQNNGLAIAGSL